MPKFILQKNYTPEEAFSLLQKQIRLSIIKDVKLSPKKEIIVSTSVLNEKIIFRGNNEIVVKFKSWRGGYIILLLFSILFFVIPAIIVGFVGYGQEKKLRKEILDILNNPRVEQNDSSTPSSTENPVEQLEKLASLKSKGIITEDEFQKKKAELMSKI